LGECRSHAAVVVGLFLLGVLISVEDDEFDLVLDLPVVDGLRLPLAADFDLAFIVAQDVVFVLARLEVSPQVVGVSDEGFLVDGVFVFGYADAAQRVPGEAGWCWVRHVTFAVGLLVYSIGAHFLPLLVVALQKLTLLHQRVTLTSASRHRRHSLCNLGSSLKFFLRIDSTTPAKMPSIRSWRCFFSGTSISKLSSSSSMYRSPSAMVLISRKYEVEKDALSCIFRPLAG
jgi:hypothetical protein